MPELKVVHIAIIAVMTIAGTVVGWVMRGSRSRAEKAAVNAGWQEQINAQRLEHDRLTDQNKGLMEQISQYQASNTDAKNRARELSAAVQEAYARRDRLQREIKNVRASLEASMTEREQLKSDISERAESSADALEKDRRIGKLEAELENWQNRLPPLIEKYRQRDDHAVRLAAELAVARERIAELEAAGDHRGGTRIEPVQDPDELTDGRDASNEPITDDEPDIDDAAGADDSPDVGDEPAVDNVAGSPRDRLQEIKGVGPAIEKTLNEMGIFRFRQIADMSEYDIDRIAKRLKGFRSRIYREDWIGQARDLCDQEPGD